MFRIFNTKTESSEQNFMSWLKDELSKESYKELIRISNSTRTFIGSSVVLKYLNKKGLNSVKDLDLLVENINDAKPKIKVSWEYGSHDFFGGSDNLGLSYTSPKFTCPFDLWSLRDTAFLKDTTKPIDDLIVDVLNHSPLNCNCIVYDIKNDTFITDELGYLSTYLNGTLEIVNANASINNYIPRKANKLKVENLSLQFGTSLTNYLKELQEKEIVNV